MENSFFIQFFFGYVFGGYGWMKKMIVTTSCSLFFFFFAFFRFHFFFFLPYVASNKHRKGWYNVFSSFLSLLETLLAVNYSTSRYNCKIFHDKHSLLCCIQTTKVNCFCWRPQYIDYYHSNVMMTRMVAKLHWPQ